MKPAAANDKDKKAVAGKEPRPQEVRLPVACYEPHFPAQKARRDGPFDPWRAI